MAQSINASGTTYGSNVIGQYLESTLEGLGNTISNLTVSGNDSFVGLTGRLYGGIIDNLGLVNETLTSASNQVGGLVGYSNGLIRNSHVTGPVTDTGDNTYDVKGLAGFNGNTIIRSFANVSVSNTGTSVGGLVGANNGPITDSFSMGPVSATSSEVGGLVGVNESSITGSYATGAVSGSSNLGGLVG